MRPIARSPCQSNLRHAACSPTFTDPQMPGHYVRITPLLLTAQRRGKVASMKWDDVGIDGTWHMANGSKREKGTAGDLTLPDFAIDIIRSRPCLASNPYVF